MIWVESLVIFLTFLVFMLGVAWWQGRGDKLERTQLHARLEEGMGRVQLPRAGRLELEGPFDLPGVLAKTGAYGPWPVDTGPLLILSEQAAALVAHEREVQAMIEAAERKIGPVQP